MGLSRDDTFDILTLKNHIDLWPTSIYMYREHQVGPSCGVYMEE